MRIRNILTIVLLLSVLILSGCNAVENESTSGSKLILLSLTGTNLSGEEGSTTVFSDVYSEINGVVNDTGVAEVSAILLDPKVNPQDATAYQHIAIDQIDVEYSRADGQNVQGVDVPYSFSQRISVQIAIGEQVEVPFVLVQHTAKLEPPLIGLVNYNTQSKILKLEAKITIHGKDIAGNRVQPLVGYLAVWCANFGDEE